MVMGGIVSVGSYENDRGTSSGLMSSSGGTGQNTTSASTSGVAADTSFHGSSGDSGGSYETSAMAP